MQCKWAIGIECILFLGIPFPNIKDAQVKLKMTYNDKRQREDKAILTGREWYEIQFYFIWSTPSIVSKCTKNAAKKAAEIQSEFSQNAVKIQSNFSQISVKMHSKFSQNAVIIAVKM